MKHALIFDSGVGGLSVVREIRARLPQLHVSFVADDAFRPYGEKTEKQLRARLPELIGTLNHMLHPDAVVIACNTASTTALPDIRAAIDVPVVGVVPAIKPAAQRTRTKTIAVLGTPGTVRRRYVDGLIKDFASDCEVRLCGSLALVEQAEIKLSGGVVDMNIIRAELAPIFAGRTGADVDAVVLACTHFPLLVEELQAAVRQTVTWIDSGAAVAKRLESVLSASMPSTPRLRNVAPSVQTAFLIGPDTSPARARAFADHGFARVVGLLP